MLKHLAAAMALCLLAIAPEAATFGYYIDGDTLADYCSDGKPCGPLSSVKGANAYAGSPYSFGRNTLDLSGPPKLTAEGVASFAAGGGSGTFLSTRGGSSLYLQYYMTVTGPGALTSIPLRVKAEGAIEVKGGPTNIAAANATMGLGILGLEGAVIRENHAIAYDQYSHGGTLTDSLSIDRFANFNVGALYEINMRVSAVATAGYDAGTFTSGPFSAKASLDPYFELGESYAALGYGLEFSAGINNAPAGLPPAPVPLPVTAPLLSAGVLLLAGLRLRWA